MSFTDTTINSVSVSAPFFDNPTASRTIGDNYYTTTCTRSSTSSSLAPLTVTFWFKSSLSYYMTALSLHKSTLGSEGGNGIQFDLLTSGVLHIGVALPDRSAAIMTYTAISADTWTHVALTISSSYDVKIYVNNELRTTATGTGSETSYDTLVIGGSGTCKC
jgi:hypothetical protein